MHFNSGFAALNVRTYCSVSFRLLVAATVFWTNAAVGGQAAFTLAHGSVRAPDVHTSRPSQTPPCESPDDDEVMTEMEHLKPLLPPVMRDALQDEAFRSALATSRVAAASASREEVDPPHRRRRCDLLAQNRSKDFIGSEVDDTIAAVAVVYDESVRERYCGKRRTREAHKAPNVVLHQRCGDSRAAENPLSEDPRILSALFYFGPPLGAGIPIAHNVQVDGDLLSSEASSTTPMAVAENFARFVTDPEFRCRKPTAYQAFSEHFGNFAPFAGERCTTTRKLLVEGENPSSRWRIVDLSEARVFQVHLLLADGGKGLGSGFGHAMLRLVVCSPNRAEVGPDCLRDISHHIVLSFRASVATPFVSAWSAIRGDYPSLLYVFPMGSILDEYTSWQSRELVSLPLALTPSEIENVVTTALEYQWTYEGEYRFVTNNCATEALHLLQRALPENRRLRRIGIARPAALLDALSSIGLLDPAVLADQEHALQDGFLFRTQDSILSNSVLRLQSYGVLDDRTTVRSYLRLPAAQRRSVFAGVEALSEPMDRLKARAALIALEEQASRSITNRVRDVLAVYLARQWDAARTPLALSDSPDLAQSIEQVAEVFALPVHRLARDGYGLPMDRAVASWLLPATHWTPLIQLKDQVSSVLPASLLEEADATNNNIRVLRAFNQPLLGRANEKTNAPNAAPRSDL
jgi:hypothetical protein